jgi:hypothetical protein
MMSPLYSNNLHLSYKGRFSQTSVNPATIHNPTIAREVIHSSHSWEHTKYLNPYFYIIFLIKAPCGVYSQYINREQQPMITAKSPATYNSVGNGERIAPFLEKRNSAFLASSSMFREKRMGGIVYLVISAC